jgi:hypothetical protein
MDIWSIGLLLTFSKEKPYIMNLFHAAALRIALGNLPSKSFRRELLPNPLQYCPELLTIDG